MAEVFKSNPIALRHSLLYQFLQKKSIERAFDDFCSTVGNDVIKKEDFQYWFYQFKQGKFDDNRDPIPDMRDILRNDKYALRACILYESVKFGGLKLKIKNESILVFSVYKKFCKVIGKNVMEYREFEFWFYRFLNGDFDLNYERDKDKKVYELIDLPIDIMRKILEYLDIVDRLSLEKTSQSLRLFSQDQKVFHDNLTFEANWNSANISFGRGDCISYKNREKDCIIEFRNREKVFHKVTCLKQAFQDFKKILENPKLYLNTFIIWLSHENSESLGKLIENALKFTHLLHVKHISLRAQSMKTLLNILPYMKPGYLTKIAININSDEAEIGKIVEMEQWKQAKYFNMSFNRFVGPLRNLYHFKEFTVSYRNLSEEEIREMIEILLKSPDFEKCTIYLQDPTVFDAGRDIYHYPIPNSTDYFEIFASHNLVKIEKKKK